MVKHNTILKKTLKSKNFLLKQKSICITILANNDSQPELKANEPTNAKHTRFKQKAAKLNYDESLNILLKNIQKR